MVNLDKYILKYLNTGKITYKYCFTNSHVKEWYESAHVCTATELLRVILYAKYDKSNLHKDMKTHCQNLIMTQQIELLKLKHKFEKLFDGTLGTWKTDPVHF